MSLLRSFTRVPRTQRFFGTAALGALGLAVGAAFSLPRLWANLLLGGYMLVGFGLAGMLFLAFHYLTGARWSDPLRPLAEKLGGLLSPAALALAAVILAGWQYYPWFPQLATPGATMWFKNLWLTPPAFLARLFACVAVWTVFGLLLRQASRRVRSGHAYSSAGAVRLSALFVVLFGVTIFLAGNDWIMSLEPDWFSTMFAVYQFSGLFQSGLAVLVLLWIVSHRNAALGDAAFTKVLHDLGKLLFGFSCFWMYIWFSQYMLLWYANLPEETVYLARRMTGLWQPVTLTSVCLNWAIPFLALLPRPAKCNSAVMFKVALVCLAGRWLDLYLMIMPPLVGGVPLFGCCEAGMLMLLIGAGGSAVVASHRSGAVEFSHCLLDRN